MNININTLSEEEFRSLPLVIKGESKEIRYAGNGYVVIDFKPTIYSFSNNRCASVEGSNLARLEASKIFIEELSKNNINHAYKEFGKRFILAQLVMPHDVEFSKYKLPKFEPNDLSRDQIKALPKAPPIEVIVKKYLTGTTKHGMIGLVGSKVRSSHPFYSDMNFENDGALPEMLIRFDWRNPLVQHGRGEKMFNQIFGDIEVEDWVRELVSDYGDRVADTVMDPNFADYFIDVKQARRTAYKTIFTLEKFLASKQIVFYDMCMFIDESGTLVYGEISPDCGRYRHLDLGSLDKDVWRTGGSSSDVIKKWNLLVSLLKGEEI